jgi:hypothetical protein
MPRGCHLPFANLVQVGARPLSMDWGPSPRLMAVICPEAIAVCRKSPLHQKLDGSLAALQLGADRIVVESIDGVPGCGTGSDGCAMQCCAVLGCAVAAWAD